MCMCSRQRIQIAFVPVSVHACVCYDACLAHVREEQAALIEEHQRQLTRNEGEQSHLNVSHPQQKTAQRSGNSPPCVYVLCVNFSLVCDPS